MNAVRRAAQHAYRYPARAQAAEATARRVVEAFAALVRDRWFDEVTLDAVAARAGVTVRTVIRRFGGKQGLIKGLCEHVAPQIRRERVAAAGNVGATVDRVLALYEDVGDMTIRNLAEELRHAELRPLVEFGRAEHRRITAETFARWLDPLDETRRRGVLDALVIATDVYSWKLLRRDMCRSATETRMVMLAIVEAILCSSKRSQVRKKGRS